MQPQPRRLRGSCPPFSVGWVDILKKHCDPKDVAGFPEPRGASMTSYAPNHGESWTPSLDRQLRRYWETRLDISQIATAMGRTPGSIESRLDVLNIRDNPKRPYWTRRN